MMNKPDAESRPLPDLIRALGKTWLCYRGETETASLNAAECRALADHYAALSGNPQALETFTAASVAISKLVAAARQRCESGHGFTSASGQRPCSHACVCGHEELVAALEAFG